MNDIAFYEKPITGQPAKKILAVCVFEYKEQHLEMKHEIVVSDLIQVADVKNDLVMEIHRLINEYKLTH